MNSWTRLHYLSEKECDKNVTSCIVECVVEWHVYLSGYTNGCFSVYPQLCSRLSHTSPLPLLLLRSYSLFLLLLLLLLLSCSLLLLLLLLSLLLLLLSFSSFSCSCSCSLLSCPATHTTRTLSFTHHATSAPPSTLMCDVSRAWRHSFSSSLFLLF